MRHFFPQLAKDLNEVARGGGLTAVTFERGRFPTEIDLDLIGLAQMCSGEVKALAADLATSEAIRTFSERDGIVVSRKHLEAALWLLERRQFSDLNCDLFEVMQ